MSIFFLQTEAVLVVHSGDIQYAPGTFDPPVPPGPNPRNLTLFSLPSPYVNNITATTYVGTILGGGSAVNGMFFDRGSRFGYDAWYHLQDTKVSQKTGKWDWEGIFPFFRKGITFTGPVPALVEKYGFTWDWSAFGNTSRIYATIPPFLWGDHLMLRQAWKDMGVAVPKECAGGDKEGLCWVPQSQHPVTARRSYAGLAHYADVVGSRHNYDLLIEHEVGRVIYRNGDPKLGPPSIEIRSKEDGRLFNLTPRAEVIISAGAIFTPAILQRSGIGPAKFLRSLGIPVVLDLPGVGSNFQDHSGVKPGLLWNCKCPKNPFHNLKMADLTK